MDRTRIVCSPSASDRRLGPAGFTANVKVSMQLIVNGK